MKDTDFSKYIDNSVNTINSIKEHSNTISEMIDGLHDCFKNGGKILIAGNGGSHSDAEHFAGELICTYKNKERSALPAVCLGSNVASITAWSNDFNYESIFSRQIESIGSKNDILFLLSTSGGNKITGQSMNIINAAEVGIKNGLTIFSLVGNGGGELSKISHKSIVINSEVTSHIQEAHITIIHLLCESFEKL